MHWRKKKRFRSFCKGIIAVCFVFIMVCMGYIIFNQIRPAPPANEELKAKVDQIAEYYRVQDSENTDSERDIIPLPMNIAAAETTELEEETAGQVESVQPPILTDEERAPDGTDTPGTAWESERRELINSVPLNPQYPDSQDLVDVLDSLMPQIAGDCMDTYDKVKACYTYLIENCSYSRTVKYDYEYDAYLLLKEKKGSCTYYAAAFHYMMRYIGLEDEIISGYRNLESGLSFHRWNEIEIDGVPYLFDTQWEDTLTAGLENQYVRFFKTYEELQGLYEK